MLGISMVLQMGGDLFASDETAAVDTGRNHSKKEREKIFIPMISIGGGTIQDRTILEVSEYTDTTDQTLWLMNAHIGLEYAMPSGFLPRGRLKGRSYIGAGFVFRPGDWPVLASQEFIWNFDLKRWLALFFGIGMGATFNATRFSRSAVHFGIPLGIRLGLVELEYSFGWDVSIAKEEWDVYDGQMTQRTATGMAPVSFYLRLRLPMLGW
jgi:hypothetical protein